MNELAVTSDEIENMEVFFSDDSLRTKRGIQDLANYIESMPDSLGKDPFPLYHEFADGVYTREIHIPKGYMIVGVMHKHESMVYMLKGKVLVADEFGSRMVEAPCKFVSKAGIKRIGFVVDDVVWIDIHATQKTTVEEAEEELFMKDYSDFDLMCEELGHSPDEVRSISENDADMIDVENDGIIIKDSNIEGKGVFATKKISAKSSVGIARICSDRTDLGRYTNHSDSPNVKCEVKNRSIYFNPIRKIKKGEEITVDYREVRKNALELDDMLNVKNKIGWMQ